MQDWRGTSSNTRQSSKPIPNVQQTDTNYEEVQMDLSEVKFIENMSFFNNIKISWQLV